ncbi:MULTISPECIES: hypothetical protein [Halomonadaceae]|jgi:hypothetical protein|uniref:Uncharacterized protein n=1 Tax=Vreelandella janggokensis TaxID=370767 RepID=A0ABT4ISL4_9GAMM|nr:MULTISPECIES: hypothetical protein [Halomonas]MCW4148096.1 hypothetical protein [Halomonas sp. 18H]MCZ0926613.1 hypothetical protein [Halomonas janggokensis]MCZ0929151.1 hypothetical protein [Halomonas janggokensis]MDR5885419.1 hypothetical protein [Halomonas janggokensis]QPL44542.1 hypothetical protein IT895_09850 [Halomonas sp. A40-4]
MDWLNGNSQAISAATSIFTVLLWLFYLQLLYNGYVRQRRPRIIINRGLGTGQNALCLISNMSSESIYIQHVAALLHTQESSYMVDVAEYQEEKENEQEGKSIRSHQGPLASGDYLHMQRFADIADQICATWQLDNTIYDQTGLQLELRVIAIYGSEDRPVGASRSFYLSDPSTSEKTLIPISVDTKRLNGRLQRRKVKRWAEEVDNLETNR